MNSDEFVKQLQLSVPPLAEYLNAGFDAKTAEVLRGDNLIPPVPLFDSKDQANPVFDLIANCDCNGKTFGVFSFSEEPFEIDAYTIFGSFEAYRVGLSKTNGAIWLMDDYDLKPISPIAADQSRFLQVLIEIVAFDSKSMIGYSYTPDQVKGFRERLIDVAGGETYREFFENFRG